jgi:hypothetical protein
VDLNAIALGARLKATKRAVIRNPQYYFEAGLTYTEVARGALGVRDLDCDTLFDARSPGIFIKSDNSDWLAGVLNSRASALFFRQLSPGILLDQAYAPSMPIFIPENTFHLEECVLISRLIKRQLVGKTLIVLQRGFEKPSKQQRKTVLNEETNTHYGA